MRELILYVHMPRNSYGRELYKPVGTAIYADNPVAKTLLKLMKKDTFWADELTEIQDNLNVEVRVQFPSGESISWVDFKYSSSREEV